MTRLATAGVLFAAIPFLFNQLTARTVSSTPVAATSVTVPATRLLARWPQATELELVDQAGSSGLAWRLHLDADVVYVDANTGRVLAQHAR